MGFTETIGFEKVVEFGENVSKVVLIGIVLAAA
jgi:hypothetical protein